MRGVIWLALGLLCGAVLATTRHAVTPAADDEPQSPFFAEHQAVQQAARRANSMPRVDGPLDVYIIAHSHCDVGFKETYEEYYANAVVNIINTVIDQLTADPRKKFIWAETAYFYMWWTTNEEPRRDMLRALLASGQWEFVGGGWSMNDEAVAHYDAVINQMTMGHEYLMETVGFKVSLGWQIDPFGASAMTPTMWRQMDFNFTVTRRINWEQAIEFKLNKHLEFEWDTSTCTTTPTNQTRILSHILDLTYSSPEGFNFDYPSSFPVPTEPITAANVHNRSILLTDQIRFRAGWFQTPVIMIPLGGDFEYQNASLNFSNMTLLIDYIMANPDTFNMKIQFGTMSDFANALHAYADANEVEWPLWEDDFLPYAEWPDTDWTGFFTSRPTLKGESRRLDANLRAAEQLYVLATRTTGEGLVLGGEQYGDAYEALWTARFAQGVMQHHDAVTGTARYAVVADYINHMGNASAAVQLVATAALNTLLRVPGEPAPNLTSDAASLASLAPGQSIPVVVVNSLAWERTQVISLGTVCVTSLEVTEKEGGSAIPAQLVQLVGSPCSDLFVRLTLPPLGAMTVIVSASNAGEGELSATGAVVSDIQRVMADSSSPVTIQNDWLLLEFTATGTLSTIQALDASYTLPCNQEFWHYASLQGSAYVFRQRGQPTQLGDPQHVTVVTGPLVQAVIAQYSAEDDNLTAITRVFQGGDDAALGQMIEQELHFGPVNVSGEGTNLVTRFNTNIENAGVFATDDSGFQLMPRQFDSRASISYSYYPAVTRAQMEPTDADGPQLSVFSAQTHGATSPAEGVLELMLHRRMTVEGMPGGGLNEPLNDTTTIVDPITLLAAPMSDPALQQIRRTLTYYRNYPLLVYYGCAGDKASGYAGGLAPMATPLPANLHLLTLKADDNTTNGPVHLRMAHLGDCMEQGNFSAAAQVIPVTLLQPSLNVSDVRTRSLDIVSDSTYGAPDEQGVVVVQASQIFTYLVSFEQPHSTSATDLHNDRIPD